VSHGSSADAAQRLAAEAEVSKSCGGESESGSLRNVDGWKFSTKTRSRGAIPPSVTSQVKAPG
jgi:hypothetical protein